MSSIAMDNSVQIKKLISDLEQKMHGRTGINWLGSKDGKALPRTFQGNPSARAMYKRSKNKYHKADHAPEDAMTNAVNNRHKAKSRGIIPGDILQILLDIIHLQDPDFRFTTIQINKNSVSKWHVDEGNKKGVLSYGFSFGEFECEPHPDTGEIGDLWIREDNVEKVINYFEKPTQFNAGELEHRTNPKVTGHRYAVLYFTMAKATELDALLNFDYLLLKDTVQNEVLYQAWLQGEDAVEKYFKKKDDEGIKNGLEKGEGSKAVRAQYDRDTKETVTFRRVKAIRAKKFDSRYQIDQNEQTIQWKKCNVLVLNLESAVARRAHMTDNLEKFGFDNAKIFKAIEGHTLKDEFTKEVDGELYIDQDKFKAPFNTPSKGQAGGKSTPHALNEIGCALTHIKAWYHAIEQGWQNLIVMEDDVVFEHNFFNNDAIKINNDAEFLQLGWITRSNSGSHKGDKEFYQSQTTEFVKYDGDLKHSRHALQTHCYLIPNRKALIKLYQLYQPYYPGKLNKDLMPKKPRSQYNVDTVLSEAIFPQLNTYLLRLPIEQQPDIKGGVFETQIRNDLVRNTIMYADGDVGQVVNTIDDSSISTADDEEKGDDSSISTADDEEKGDDSSISVAKDDSSTSVAINDDQIFTNQYKYIFIAYINDDEAQLGGWRSFIVHLYYSLYQYTMLGLYPVVVVIKKKTKKGNIKKVKNTFGYDVPCIGLTMEQLAEKKHVLIACITHSMDKLPLFKNHSIVIHDPVEIPKFKLYHQILQQMNVIVIRQTMEINLKKIGIKSTFLKHPFYRFPLVTAKKTAVINTGRVCSRKRTEMIMKANVLLNKETGHAGVIEIHSSDDVPRGGECYVRDWAPKDSRNDRLIQYPDRKPGDLIKVRYKDGVTGSRFQYEDEEDGLTKTFDNREGNFNYNETQKQYNVAYKGGFDMTFEATAKVYSRAHAVVDLSRFNGDGGGTQYTFLEAAHCGCLLILHDDWLKPEYPSPYKNGLNCLTVKSEKDLAALVLAFEEHYVDGEFIHDIDNHPHMVHFDSCIQYLKLNAEKMLKQHDNGDLWVMSLLSTNPLYYGDGSAKFTAENGSSKPAAKKKKKKRLIVKKKTQSINMEAEQEAREIHDELEEVLDDEYKEDSVSDSELYDDTVIGIADERCLDKDMRGTPPEFKKKYGYDKWFDPCPYPPAEWNGLEIDWLVKEKLFINPPFSQKAKWFEKCMATMNEAKEQHKPIQIHFLVPLATPAYMEKVLNYATKHEFLFKRLQFKDLSGKMDKKKYSNFNKDCWILKYEYDPLAVVEEPLETDPNVLAERLTKLIESNPNDMTEMRLKQLELALPELPKGEVWDYDKLIGHKKQKGRLLYNVKYLGKHKNGKRRKNEWHYAEDIPTWLIKEYQNNYWLEFK